MSAGCIWRLSSNSGDITGIKTSDLPLPPSAQSAHDLACRVFNLISLAYGIMNPSSVESKGGTLHHESQ